MELQFGQGDVTYPEGANPQGRVDTPGVWEVLESDATRFVFRLTRVPPSSAIPIGVQQDSARPIWIQQPDKPGRYNVEVDLRGTTLPQTLYGTVMYRPGPPASTQLVFPPSAPGQLAITPATPGTSILGSFSAGFVVRRAQLRVETPFDGTLPTIRLGSSAQPDMVFGSSFADLTRVGAYETTEVAQFAVADNFILTFNSGGSAHGAATLWWW